MLAESANPLSPFLYEAWRNGRNFNGLDYESQTRQQKLDSLWERITRDEQAGSTQLWKSVYIDMSHPWEWHGDEMKCGFFSCRKKVFHARGGVAKASWQDLGGHSYTGVFKGADSMIVRTSYGAEPEPTDSSGGAAGFAAKFLRDGIDSANILSIGGLSSLDYFEGQFKNQIGASSEVGPLGRFFLNRFNNVNNFTNSMGLSFLAEYDQYGTQETEIVMPFRIRLVATEEFNFPDSAADGYTDHLQHFMELKSGTTLFDVYALDMPTALGGTE